MAWRFMKRIEHYYQLVQKNQSEWLDGDARLASLTYGLADVYG